MTEAANDATFVNSLVKIFLRSGHIVVGLVKEWNENGVKLVNINGDETRIPHIDDICAVTLKFDKSGKLIRAKKNNETNIPEHITANPESFLEVHKAKATNELEEFREAVMSQENISIPEVVHGSQLSVIRSIKNDPKI